MSARDAYLVDFLRSESGAVTVDWVVLSASIVGLGIAVIAVIANGVQGLSNGIGTSLANVEIQTRFAEALEEIGFASLDFSGDTGGFSGGALVTLPGIGDVLQLGPGESTTASFGMPAGASEATVEFDLFGLDTLNGEEATISVNGEIAGTVSVDNGVATFNAVNGGSTNFEAFNSSQGTDLNGNGESDSVTQVRMTVGNPGETLDVQITSGAGAGVDNESYAIDNVSVSAI